MEFPEAIAIPRRRQQRQGCVTLQRGALWAPHCLLLSVPIHSATNSSGLADWLISGRAGGKMTGSQGLRALCSSFYPPDFLRLETWLPLSWRNVKTILNRRTQAGENTRHWPLPVPLVSRPQQGGWLCSEGWACLGCPISAVTVLELAAVLSK